MRKKIRKIFLSIVTVTPLLFAYAETPKPIFELPFDGNPNAITKGKSQPLKAENLSYVDGVKGKAVFIAQNSILEYSTDGNLNQERGTVTLWFKPNWRASEQSSDNRANWHCILSQPFPKGSPGKDARHGSGALWFWFWGHHYRGDISDINDSYLIGGNQDLDQTKWVHLAMTWDIDKGHCIYMNGIPAGMPGDGNSPLNVKNRARDFSALKNKFTSFFIGSQEGKEAKADGLIDEFKIYDKALSQEEILSDMGTILPLKLDYNTVYCITGDTVKFKWELKNISSQDISSTCSWQIQSPSGTIITEGNEHGSTLKPGMLEQFVSKIKTTERGEYKFSVNTGNGPKQFASIWALRKNNPYLKPANTKLESKLIEIIDFVKGVPQERFVKIGECKIEQINGRTYLEAGQKKNDRFAVKVDLPLAQVPYLIEWEYPDDKVRTMEMIAQSAKHPGEDYGLQTGVFCGDEYKLSMKILTHRSILWARTKDYAFIFMTAREGKPAAVSELRIYSIIGGFPDAGIKEAPLINGWTRTVGIHFEDPSIGFDFGVTHQLMPEYEETLDRLIAYMKWSGQNLLSYPAIWYQGVIGRSYQPRPHPDNYIGCILAKFAENNLGFMAAINLQNIKVPEGIIIDSKTVEDGSLHNTPVMILSDGKPNPGGWHGTPPNFNPLHPLVQRFVDSQIDKMLDLYGGNPAFKGITMHLTKHTIPWFGSIEAGYNDYNIEAFEKDTGIKVDVNRKDPLRGKLYYNWIMSNARDKWIDWRCEKIAEWYKNIAKRMAAKRPDLKLAIYSYNPTISDHHNDNRFKQEDFTYIINKESGINPELYKNIPNIILTQTIYPSDYRQMSDVPWLAPALPLCRDIHKKSEAYSLLNDATFPWINMHDRYFEDAVGRPGKWWGGDGNPLKANWLVEHGWRVSTLNPNINSFLEHYILPLKYNDIFGFTKGGFLIGTCGVEEKIAEFARAFRAIPAQKFHDLSGKSKNIKARYLFSPETTWFYAVNTGTEPESITFIFDESPGAIIDLVSAEKLTVPGNKIKIDMHGYQIRSFKVEKGIKIKAIE